MNAKNKVDNAIVVDYKEIEKVFQDPHTTNLGKTLALYEIFKNAEKIYPDKNQLANQKIDKMLELIAAFVRLEVLTQNLLEHITTWRNLSPQQKAYIQKFIDEIKKIK